MKKQRVKKKSIKNLFHPNTSESNVSHYYVSIENVQRNLTHFACKHCASQFQSHARLLEHFKTGKHKKNVAKGELRPVATMINHYPIGHDLNILYCTFIVNEHDTSHYKDVNTHPFFILKPQGSKPLYVCIACWTCSFIYCSLKVHFKSQYHNRKVQNTDRFKSWNIFTLSKVIRDKFLQTDVGFIADMYVYNGGSDNYCLGTFEVSTEDIEPVYPSVDQWETLCRLKAESIQQSSCCKPEEMYVEFPTDAEAEDIFCNPDIHTGRYSTDSGFCDGEQGMQTYYSIENSELVQGHPVDIIDGIYQEGAESAKLFAVEYAEAEQCCVDNTRGFAELTESKDCLAENSDKYVDSNLCLVETFLELAESDQRLVENSEEYAGSKRSLVKNVEKAQCFSLPSILSNSDPEVNNSIDLPESRYLKAELDTLMDQTEMAESKFQNTGTCFETLTNTEVNTCMEWAESSFWNFKQEVIKQTVNSTELYYDKVDTELYYDKVDTELYYGKVDTELYYDKVDTELYYDKVELSRLVNLDTHVLKPDLKYGPDIVEQNPIHQKVKQITYDKSDCEKVEATGTIASRKTLRRRGQGSRKTGPKCHKYSKKIKKGKVEKSVNDENVKQTTITKEQSKLEDYIRRNVIIRHNESKEIERNVQSKKCNEKKEIESTIKKKRGRPVKYKYICNSCVFKTTTEQLLEEHSKKHKLEELSDNDPPCEKKKKCNSSRGQTSGKKDVKPSNIQENGKVFREEPIVKKDVFQRSDAVQEKSAFEINNHVCHESPFQEFNNRPLADQNIVENKKSFDSIHNTDFFDSTTELGKTLASVHTLDTEEPQIGEVDMSEILQEFDKLQHIMADESDNKKDLSVSITSEDNENEEIDKLVQMSDEYGDEKEINKLPDSMSDELYHEKQIGKIQEKTNDKFELPKMTTRKNILREMKTQKSDVNGNNEHIRIGAGFCGQRVTARVKADFCGHSDVKNKDLKQLRLPGEKIKESGQRHPRSKKSEGKIQFQCKQCNFKSSLRIQLDRHSKSKHNKSKQEDKYSCSYCEYKARSKHHMRIHFRQACQTYCEIAEKCKAENLKKKKRLRIKYLHSCRQCEFKTKNRRLFEKHKQRHSNDEISTNTQTNTSGNFWYYCRFCEYKTMDRRSFEAHSKQHEENHTKPPASASGMACEICKVVTTNYFLHNKTHQIDLVYMPYIDDEDLVESANGLDSPSETKSNSSENSSEDHQYSSDARNASVKNSLSKKFTCNLCDTYSTMFRLNLTHHVFHQHRDLFVVWCDYCPFACMNRQLLNQHIQYIHIMPGSP